MEAGVILSGGWAGQWKVRTAVPVVVFLANQEDEEVGGAGKGWVELAAPPGARRALGERNPVKIRVGGRFNHRSVPIGLFLKGDAPLSRDRSLGSEGGDRRRLRSKAAALGLGTGRCCLGKGASFHFLFQPRGRRRDARRLATTARAGDEVAGPLPAALPGGSPGEAGQDGWQASPPGRRLLTDTVPLCSPRINRKPVGATAGPWGAPRAGLSRAPPFPVPGSTRVPAPLGARRRRLARLVSRAPGSPSRSRLCRAPRAPGAPASLARLLLARRALLAHCLLADSREPPGWEEGGGWEVQGGRRPGLRHPGCEGRAWEQT